MAKKDSDAAKRGYDATQSLASIAEERVAGDLVDHIIGQVERLKKPFADLSAARQAELVRDIEAEVRKALRIACFVVAGRDHVWMAGNCRGVTLKGDEVAEAKVSIPLENALGGGLDAAAHLSGKPVVIIGAEPDEWLHGLGEWVPADDQGTLELAGADEGTTLMVPLVGPGGDQLGTAPCPNADLRNGDTLWLKAQGGGKVPVVFERKDQEAAPVLLWDGEPSAASTIEGFVALA